MIRTKQCKYNIECKCNNVIEYSYTLPTQNSWVIFPLTQPQVAKRPQIKLLVTSKHSTFWTFVLSGFQMVWPCDQADHLNTGHFRPKNSIFCLVFRPPFENRTIPQQDMFGRGLNLDLLDCTLACYQLSHPCLFIESLF